jgi:cytochrome c oxidase assembly protein subunit 15
MIPYRRSMTNATSHAPHHRAVRIWLLAVAALIFAMVAVGGATRLTESGLSIVEWQPVTGALPPLSASEWQGEFEKYQAIPQYRALNSGMTLDQFKTIYWWEWTHRLLGRLIGAAFLLPFLWFLWKGWIEARLGAPLAVIFGLGAFEGAVGWWMVSSGLAGRTEVSQYRLAFHLTLACLIYTATIWTAQRLRPTTAAEPPLRQRAGAAVLLGLVLAQIYLGALVAGLRAGLIFNTWPLIEGRLLPPAAELFSTEPWWRNLFENPLTVQFDHRMIAYALWLAAMAHAVDLIRTGRKGSVLWGALALACAVTLQAALGILTLIEQAPLALALTHQAMAMIVLTIAAIHAQRMTASRELVAAPVMMAPSLDAAARG